MAQVVKARSAGETVLITMVSKEVVAAGAWVSRSHTRRLDRGGILPQQYLRQLGSMHRAMKSICYDDVRR